MSQSAEELLSANDPAVIARGIGIYISIWFVAFLFASTFFLRNFQILLPTFAVILVFLCFSLRLRLQVQENIFGEIGFIYLAFAVAYTVFPAYGFLTLESLSSGPGFQNLALLEPDQHDLGLHLWRHVLFVAAVGLGYLVFRGRLAPKFDSFRNLGDAEKPIIQILFVIVLFSVIVLWGLSAPVTAYIDNYTRYDHLPWIGRRVVTICTVLKMAGTFILLSVMFQQYVRYRLHILSFVLLRTVYEVQNSLGARIEAFSVLIAVSVLYHYCSTHITLKKGFLAVLACGLVFSVIEVARSADLDFPAFKETISQGQGLPVGELGAVYVPGFHLYSERSQGTLPPREWPILFNDFISLVPLIDQTKWHPMYWYARNYFPDAVVPPLTLGPIANSALWGGEVDLAIRGLINGSLFALLMRWFAREGEKWQVMTIYVFCYSTCIMCLKYSIFYHLTPLVKIILPLLLIVSVLVKDIQRSTEPAPEQSLSTDFS